MPLVRVHKASDGKFFEDYKDYVVHQEALNFQDQWNETFGDAFKGEGALGQAFFNLAHQHKDALAKVIENSKVKNKGGRKK